jgi:integrase
MVNRISIPAGWERGGITSKMLRHTYCAARLQTLDRVAPVSPDTVRREMGHNSRDLVEQVYGHLGTIRLGPHPWSIRSNRTRNGGRSGWHFWFRRYISETAR